MQKTVTTVLIGGKEYALASTESAEHMHRVAIYVDRRLQEVGKNIYSVSPLTGVMITAINIADGLLKLEDTQDANFRQMQEQQELIGQQRERIAELQAQVLRLQREAGRNVEGRRLNIPDTTQGRRTSERGK